MSLYRTGDPVLLSDPDAVWVRAFYLACNDNATDGLPHLTVAVDPTAKFGVATRWVADDRIRPDPDYALVRRDAPPEPARTGWRLPEPGDVVRISGSERLRKIRNVDWARADPIETNDGLWWYVSSCTPEPATTPGPLGTLDACRKQVIADNAALEALAVQLEQDGHDAHAALARSLMRRWGDA